MILSSGFCNAESVLEAPLDFPVCGYRGVLCPPKAPSEVAPSTISLVSLITIVLGVLLIGSTSIGYIIRKRNRLMAKKGLGSGEKETKTQKRSTLGDR